MKGAQALRRYKPRTPGLRHLVRAKNEHLWKGRPINSLTFAKTGQGKAGRNASGQVTVRHRGGGHKRRIRTIDYDRKAPGRHYVERIEYDPNRTAHIALVTDMSNGNQSYIIAAEGMRQGDTVTSYREGIPQELIDSMGGDIDQGVLASKTAWRGNCLPMGMIPLGTPVFNIAIKKDGPAKYCRSAGTHGIIVSKGEDTVQKEMIKSIDSGSGGLQEMNELQLKRYEEAAKYVTVKLSSGEVRLIEKEAVATIGVASNANHQYTQLGKAGRKRWLGIRPTVRGLAMNAMDHPHGGGRGKSKGNVHPKSPWGKPVSLYTFSLMKNWYSSFCRPNRDTKLVTSTSLRPWLWFRDRGTKANEGVATIDSRRSVYHWPVEHVRLSPPWDVFVRPRTPAR